MSKILTIVCAVALVVAFAATSEAAVQNVKVSGDITTYGIWRDDYDLDSSTDIEGDDDAWYQTTTRLQIDADLTDNVMATIRLLNERDWAKEDTANNANTDIDLDLAYVTLEEMLYSPLTLTIGRQELSDLTDLIVGDPDTNSVSNTASITADELSARKAFDSIRADLDYSPWLLTGIIAKIEDEDVTSTSDSDEDLYGVNVAYDFAQNNATGEGYVFVKNDESSQDQQEIYAIGLKGSMDPAANLTLAGEVAMQTGDYSGSQDIDAWALDLSGNYVWADNQYTPNLGIAYIYRSGDNDTNSGDYEAWDTMYENQTHGVVANAILGGINNNGVDSNAEILKISGAINPTDVVNIALDYYRYWLDEKVSSLSPASNATSYSVNSNEDNLGDEVDLTLTYDYTEDVQFGLCYGIFMPDDVFSSSNDDDASQVLGSVKVVF